VIGLESAFIFTVCMYLFIAVARVIHSCNVFCLCLCMQGGVPSPFDRNMGSRMAIKCAEKLLEQIQASKTADGPLYIDFVKC